MTFDGFDHKKGSAKNLKASKGIEKANPKLNIILKGKKWYLLWVLYGTFSSNIHTAAHRSFHSL
jgi:hypothetical protein